MTTSNVAQDAQCALRSMPAVSSACRSFISRSDATAVICRGGKGLGLGLELGSWSELGFGNTVSLRCLAQMRITSPPLTVDSESTRPRICFSSSPIEVEPLLHDGADIGSAHVPSVRPSVELIQQHEGIILVFQDQFSFGYKIRFDSQVIQERTARTKPNMLAAKTKGASTMPTTEKLSTAGCAKLASETIQSATSKSRPSCRAAGCRVQQPVSLAKVVDLRKRGRDGGRLSELPTSCKVVAACNPMRLLTYGSAPLIICCDTGG